MHVHMLRIAGDAYDSTMAGSIELLLRQPIGFKRGFRDYRAKSFSDVTL